MGVPIIENWSKISAEILGIRESTDIEAFREVEMRIHLVEPVNDFPNLLSETAGANLTVHFPADLVEQKNLSPGTRVSCWVRKAGHSRCFVHREHVECIDTGEYN